MNNKFNPQNLAKLDSPERRKLLPPEEVCQNAGIKEGDIIADIGTGTGYFLIPLSRIIGETGKAYGIDIVDEMLDAAEKNAQKAGLENIEFLKSGESTLPLPDASVDVAFLANVIHEANDINSFTRELVRIIKPGGALVIVEWKKEPMEMGPSVNHRVSVEELKEITAQAGINYQLDVSVGKGHYLFKGIK